MTFDGYVVVRYVPLPAGIHGMINEDPDGLANIYVNESDTREEQEKTVLHEMNHFYMGHLGSGMDIADMEGEAEAI